MSDAFRKDFSTRAGEKLTPNATKSTQEKLKESVTSTADRVVRGVQPDSSKSDSQAFVDKNQRASDRHVHGGTAESVGDKFKDAVGMNKHTTTTNHHHHV